MLGRFPLLLLCACVDRGAFWIIIAAPGPLPLNDFSCESMSFWRSATNLSLAKKGPQPLTLVWLPAPLQSPSLHLASKVPPPGFPAAMQILRAVLIFCSSTQCSNQQYSRRYGRCGTKEDGHRHSSPTSTLFALSALDVASAMQQTS